MRLAICVAVKNRSCVIVDKEDSFSFLHHLEEKIEDSPDFQRIPLVTKGGQIVLLLLPHMLSSLKKQKTDEDDWVLVVVDYKSTDVDMKAMLEEEIGDAMPWHLEIIQDYDYFDRGGGLAKAADIAETKFQADAFFFCDADMMFDSREVLDRALQLSGEKKFFYPICFSFANDDHSKGFWRDTGFGIFASSREDYRETDGWQHNISWGWEDRALCDTIPKDKKVREKMPGFFHQWHPFQWDFRVKEYPVKEYIFKGAAIKSLENVS